jgi:hypothetical protein
MKICTNRYSVPYPVTPTGTVVHDNDDCRDQYVVISDPLPDNDTRAWDGERGINLTRYALLYIREELRVVIADSVHWRHMHLADIQDAMHYLHAQKEEE